MTCHSKKGGGEIKIKCLLSYGVRESTYIIDLIICRGRASWFVSVPRVAPGGAIYKGPYRGPGIKLWSATFQAMPSVLTLSSIKKSLLKGLSS